jgi:hypothetical protein
VAAILPDVEDRIGLPSSLLKQLGVSEGQLVSALKADSAAVAERVALAPIKEDLEALPSGQHDSKWLYREYLVPYFTSVENRVVLQGSVLAIPHPTSSKVVHFKVVSVVLPGAKPPSTNSIRHGVVSPITLYDCNTRPVSRKDAAVRLPQR